jgi:hypothetical protein
MSGWGPSSVARDPSTEIEGVSIHERPAGADQVVVLYLADDTGSAIDPGVLYAAVADDAAARSSAGWRIVSTDSVPIRQMGTAGNILFQSGGQFTSQAAVAVVYRRAAPNPAGAGR